MKVGEAFIIPFPSRGGLSKWVVNHLENNQTVEILRWYRQITDAAS